MKSSAAKKSVTAEKLVYHFGDGKAEGSVAMKNLLGGKGANLADMCALGLPVPPGFTITTEVCVAYYAAQKTLPTALQQQVADGITAIENSVGKKFGDASNPLLVSVRSGARASMPGMMDTILNLGLNDATVEGLAKKTGNPRFAYDSYRRFIQMYANVVLDVSHHLFEDLLDLMKNDRDVSQDTDLSANDLKDLVAQYKERVEQEIGAPFPQKVEEQLWGAIRAVFDSWMNPRAVTYRTLNDIPAEWGTAVNVQSMVFGNMGEDSATGVAFTRNPSTGAKMFYGEFLVNAQGEDVVAGIRTPQPLTIAGKSDGGDLPSMEEVMPDVFAELVKIYQKLEAHYRDMQDIEFTVENRKLWMLQTRNGKRTAKAGLKIAVDMVSEKLITKEEALLRIDPASLDQLLHPALDPNAKKQVIAKGLPASPGAASGRVVFTAEDAEHRAAINEKVILVRIETSPEDIHGMHAAKGILTARGGMTSHAAVVARGMGKCCVSGAGELRINYARKEFIASGLTVREGDLITLNGSTGEVMLGEVPTIEPSLSGDFATVIAWADAVRTLKVRTNAETPHDAETARNFGAEGIGLCRTEHMFFEADRITAVREMIVAETRKARETALAKLLPMQRRDFVEIFRIMDGLPVTIRLLDPPLHEFLPHTEEEMQQVADAAHIPLDLVKYRATQLHESNPMLGHRGCRLGVTFPEIYAMQARAIFEAAAEVQKEGKRVLPEVMIPLVMTRRELTMMKAVIDEVASEISKSTGTDIRYQVGTMIELPRAALRAGEIAEDAEFFSFGTNDLTQTTLGISRDDAASFIEDYKRKAVIEQDPFVTLDQEGVGELIKLATERGRKTRPTLKLGICGEHGGDPASIHFCHRAGLDYVSCSPYRVPVARLAAAQAALKATKEKIS
ncbi:MAG: pyruvate, phosphate dikinase [Alphaproteobacteria bacterium]